MKRRVWIKTIKTRRVTYSPTKDGDLRKTISVTITRTEIIKKR